MNARERFARNNDPERIGSYVRPALTIALGIVFLLSATSVLALVVSVLLFVFGGSETAMLLARLWMRRRTQARRRRWL